MDHPARQRPWGTRELAAVLGVSPGTIAKIASGRQRTVPVDLAVRFAEAVGVETAVLFVPSLSAESYDTAGETA